MESAVRQVVVVGGGFAGMNFATALANHKDYEVTLVDTNNYHSFSPLLYQVGMAFIEPSNISYPFRKLFQNKGNLRFHLGALQSVDVAAKTITTSTGELPYDYLVLALGTESNFFGMENVKKDALPLKTISDATNLRNHLLLNMERAVRAKNSKDRARLLTTVIAGAGPTGVEVAGMLAEMAKKIGAREYPEIRDLKPAIYLVEPAPRVLGPMSKGSQQEALRVLQGLGVKVLLNAAVKDYVDGNVILGDGRAIPTDVLIWTSGVIGRQVPGIPTSSVGPGRRIYVDQFNKVDGVDDVFAIGDIALDTSDKRYPNGHPQLAQAAIQQANTLAKNFKRRAAGRPLKPFRYKDKGSMAIISKYNAVVDLPKMFLKGFVAWGVWLFVHLMPLVGFRNRMKLAFNWLWSFITDDPTLRLIIRPKQDITNGQGEPMARKRPMDRTSTKREDLVPMA